MSGFRKFGTSDDQKVEVTIEDAQPLQKTSSNPWSGKATVKWTKKDAQELVEESSN